MILNIIESIIKIYYGVISLVNFLSKTYYCINNSNTHSEFWLRSNFEFTFESQTNFNNFREL